MQEITKNIPFYSNFLTDEENSIIRQIGGVHRCYLDKPIHLDFVSEGLCNLTGYPESYFFGPEVNGKYTKIILPEDVPHFVKFVDALASEDGCLTVKYRIVRKDGSLLPVHDTMVSRTMEDGHRWGYSIVMAAESEMDEGRVDENSEEFDLYGVVDCAWGDEYPDGVSITYCNDVFLELLGFDHDAVREDHQHVMAVVNRFLKESILRFTDERTARFASEHHHGFLKKVDKSFVEISCWERRISDDPKICRLMCVPVSDENIFARKNNRVEFLDAMKVAYDVVLEVDTVRNFIECTHNVLPHHTLKSNDLPRNLQEALAAWGSQYLTKQSKKHLDEYFYPLAHVDAPSGHNYAKHFISEILVDGKATPVDVLLYKIDSLLLVLIKLLHKDSFGIKTKQNRVRIKTFDYFDVFVDDEPLVFKHPKARELFALLVDREGSPLKNSLASQLLWPDEVPSKTVQARFRKVVMYLNETLQEAGVPEIIESTNRSRRLLTDYVDCDLYSFIDQKDQNVTYFGGRYMYQYEWGEYRIPHLNALEKKYQELNQ